VDRALLEAFGLDPDVLHRLAGTVQELMDRHA